MRLEHLLSGESGVQTQLDRSLREGQVSHGTPPFWSALDEANEANEAHGSHGAYER